MRALIPPSSSTWQPRQSSKIRTDNPAFHVRAAWPSLRHCERQRSSTCAAQASKRQLSPTTQHQQGVRANAGLAAATPVAVAARDELQQHYVFEPLLEQQQQAEPAAALPHLQRWQRHEHPSRQQRQEQRQQRLREHDTAALEAASAASKPYIPAPTAAGRDRQVTAHISGRRHWSQLQSIWLDNSSSFTPIHLTATITKLARLVEAQGVAAADRPELFKFSSAIMSSIRHYIILGTLDPRGAAQCLWAYAKLQSVSPHSSRSGDAAADALAAAIAQRHMQLLRPQELSQIAWAAAVLKPAGFVLPQAWWQQFEQRVLLLLPAMQPAEVACCAWAAAKTCHTPPEPYIAALLQHVAGSMADYAAPELLQLQLAVAAWQYKPWGDWQYSCCQQLQQVVGSMSPQDISNSLLAFARLQAAPPRELLSALLQQLQQQLPTCCPRVLVTVPYALAKLHLNPSGSWWGGFLPYTTAALHCCSPSALAVLAWSLARLGLNPGQGWLQELLQQSGHKLRGFAAQELAMLAWALGRWGAAPSRWWWEGFEQASAGLLEDLTAAELGALLCGMSGIVIPAPPAAAAAGATAGPGVASSSAGAALPDSGNRLAQQQQQQQQQPTQQQQYYTPSGSWTAQLLLAAQKALAGAPADCLGGILMGLAKLTLRPSLAWLEAFEAAACAALPTASMGNVAAVLWGFAAMEVQPSRVLMAGLNDRMCELLLPLVQPSLCKQRGSSSVSGVQGVAAAAAAAGSGATGSYWVPWQVVGAGAGSSPPSLAVASQLLWALCHLPDPVGAPWVDDLLQAVAPALPAASNRSLVTMLWALAKLQHVPGCPGWLRCWWSAYAGQLQAAAATAAAAGTGRAAVGDGGNNTSSGAAAAAALEDSRKNQSQQQEEQQQLQHVSADGHPCSSIAVVLWSFSALHASPSNESWLQVVLDGSKPLLHTASGRQLAGLLKQLVLLRVWPGDEWLAAAAAAVAANQQGMQQHHQQQQELEQEVVQKARHYLSRLAGWGM